MTQTDRTVRSHAGRTAGRPLVALLALAVAVGLLALPGAVPRAAAATDGLTETGHARYEVRAGGRVTAEITTTLTNVTPDRGNTYYYWNSYTIGIPASATDLRATSGGYPLTVRREGTDDPGTEVAVATFSPLRYGRTRTVEWTYTIGGAPFRSEQRSRVGKGFATFAAQVPGDDGRTSLEIAAPKTMRFDASEAFARDHRAKRTVYTLDERTDEGGIWAAVSLRDPDVADTTEVTVGDQEITLSSFPGDERWTRFAARQVEQGIPALAELVGSDWPASVDEVREDASPNVLGYGGWFSDDTRRIVVDESLDPGLLLHELTHAWINDDTVRDRWLSEGLTEVIAQRGAAVIEADAEERPAPRRRADVAFPLARWAGPYTLEAEAEAYGYDASYTAIKKLTAGLDDEAFAAFVADVYAGNSAYAAPGSPRQLRATTDWRRFVDLLDAHDAGDGAAKVLRRWVLTSDGKKQLSARAEARESYAATDDADGPWTPPLGLRTAMSRWQFDLAATRTEQIDGAPGLAAEVQRTSEAAGLAVPDDVRAAYEQADDDEEYVALVPTLTLAATSIDQVGAVSRSVDTEQDPVTELGQRILEVDALAAAARGALSDGELEQAQRLATETGEQADRATGVGAAVVAGVVLVLALLVLGAWLLVRRVRRRRRRAVLTEPQVVAVVEAPAEDRSVS